MSAQSSYEPLIESRSLRKGLRLVARPWSRDVEPRRLKKRCALGKIRWESEQDALVALSRLPDVGGRVYHCPVCGRWHVTRAGAAT